MTHKIKEPPKIKKLNKKKIEENLKKIDDGFSEKDHGRQCYARYASFDYCFNYFQSLKNKKEIKSKQNMQNSCLHLGFYLASWGMLRGSSFLLQKSIKFYKPIINYIADKDNNFWKLDVKDYNKEENVEKIIKCGEEIGKILKEENRNKVSDIQITKIMLGVFGNIPAFDNYFKNGSGLKKFNKNSLKEIHKFYKKNKNILEQEAKKIKTFDFNKINNIKKPVFTKRSYTVAKIIDMIFFTEGFLRSKIKK